MLTFEKWLEVHVGQSSGVVARICNLIHDTTRSYFIQSALRHSIVRTWTIPSRSEGRSSIKTPLKVHLHIHCRSIASIDVETLFQVPALHTVYLTFTSSGESAAESFISNLKTQRPDVLIHQIYIPEAHSDLEGLIAVLSVINTEEQCVLLKIHEKCSCYRKQKVNEEWTSTASRDLLLLLAKHYDNLIMRMENENIGIVYSRKWAGSREALGRNRQAVDYLLESNCIREKNKYVFPMGSIFILSTSYISYLQKANLNSNLTNGASGSGRDGSHGHALERFIGAYAASLGFGSLLIDHINN